MAFLAVPHALPPQKQAHTFDLFMFVRRDRGRGGNKSEEEREGEVKGKGREEEEATDLSDAVWLSS